MSDSERRAKELLFSAAPSAVEALIATLKSPDEAVKVRAAATILQKVWPSGVESEVEELLNRLARLEGSDGAEGDSGHSAAH